MKQEYFRKEIANGIFFTAIIDPKFKSNRLSFNLLVPLNKQTVTENAIVPFLLRKGNKECPDFTKLNKKLNELYGAYLGADASKIGDSQLINIFIQSLDDRYALENEQVTEECTKLLCNMLTKPNINNNAFPTKDLELEQQSLIDLIESEINDKRTYAILRLYEIMCKDEPYGIKKYGYVEDANAITAESAAKAYESLVAQADIEILFIGSGDYTKSMNIITSCLSNIQRNNIKTASTDVVTEVNEVKTVCDVMDIAQAKLVIGFRTGISAKDANVNAARVMIAMYGATPNSKLFMNVREKLSLCYYCAARYDRHKGIMVVDSGVENGNIKAAKDEIINQLELIKKGEFTEEDINAAKLSLCNSFKSVPDSLGSLESYYFGQIYADTIRDIDKETEDINAVTKQDIIDAAKCVKLDTIYVLSNEKAEL